MRYCKKNSIVYIPLFLIILIMNSFCLTAPLLAQEGLEAYDRGNLTQIQNDLDQGLYNTPETEFLRALFTTNADSALEIYQKIALNHPESAFALRAKERIRQYYYAQGLYIKAEEISRSIGDWKPPKRRLRKAESTPPPPYDLSVSTPQQIPNQPPSSYCLQVGAFSDPANAKALKMTLEKEGYRVTLLSPSETKTGLYALRVTGYKTENEAESSAAELQRKYDLKPLILPIDYRR